VVLVWGRVIIWFEGIESLIAVSNCDVVFCFGFLDVEGVEALITGGKW